MWEKKSKIVLGLYGISKVYPGTVALHDVTLEIEKGVVHGIIGKNGAGKTTLVGIIAGIISPTKGEIVIEDRHYANLSCIMARQENIAIVPQDPQLMLDLSVAENLFIPNYHLASKGRRIHWDEMYSKAENILKKAGLSLNPRAQAGELSISDRQLVLVVKACYVEQARIIILDEVSASLTQEDEKLLYRIIDERKREGKTILFISHRTDELLEICDRVTVLRDGRSVTTVSCDTLNLEKLSSLIVGEEFRFQRICNEIATCDQSEKETVLEVQNLTRLGAFQNISFTLKDKEVLGIAGLRGSGRTEIFRSIMGIDLLDEGWIKLKGKKVRFASPADALKKGLAFLPEDRENEGIISSLSVRENLVLSALKKITRIFCIHKQTEKEMINQLIRSLDIKISSSEQEVSQLSGGNKQKVVVGRIVANQPRVYILDEPTRGIDIAAKESVLKIIREQLSLSGGIIMTSPGLEDLLLVCDRILVLYRGRLVAEIHRENFSETTLFNAVQGGTEANQAAGVALS